MEFLSVFHFTWTVHSVESSRRSRDAKFDIFLYILIDVSPLSTRRIFYSRERLRALSAWLITSSKAIPTKGNKRTNRLVESVAYGVNTPPVMHSGHAQWKILFSKTQLSFNAYLISYLI